MLEDVGRDEGKRQGIYSHSETGLGCASGSLASSPLQDNLLLDMYLAPHVRTLYTQIRNRALIQVSRGGVAEAVWGADILWSSG